MTDSHTLADQLIEILVAEIQAGSPDYDIGGLLLAQFIAAEYDARGISSGLIDLEVAANIVDRVQYAESIDIKNTNVEKALRKAAAGDFEEAGRVIRHHMLREAEIEITRQQLVTLIEIRLKGQRRGGAQTAAATKKRNADRDQRVIQYISKLLEEGHDPRYLNSKAARYFRLHRTTISRIRAKNK